MSPGSPADAVGAGAADISHGDSAALATLYPACLSCRHQIDSLLASIDKSGVPYTGKAPSASSSPGTVGFSTGASRRRDGSTARLHPHDSSNGSRSTSTPAGMSVNSGEDMTGDGRNVATQQRLLGLSQQLSRDVGRLCDAFERERPQLTQQQMLLWQRRITGLRDDAASLASAVHAEVGSMQSWMQDERRQREELLQLRGSRGRSRYGSAKVSSASAADKEERAAATRWQRERREEHETELAWLREREKLQESGMMLESIFSQGRGVLDRVVQQNSVLRNARKKLMKLTSAAGVSSTLIRAAARREASDRRLIYGGMLVTLLFFFLVYRFAHSYSLRSLLWLDTLPADPAAVQADIMGTRVAGPS